MSNRILHIIIKSSYNGATVYAVRLCQHLKEYEQEIVSCFKGNAYEEIIKSDFNCVNLLSNEDISYKYLFIKYWRFFRYLKKKSFDIIHYHQGGIGILLLASLFGKKANIIHHLHSGSLIGDNKTQNISFLHLLILKYLSRRTYQIAAAEHVLNEYSEKIQETKNLKLIKNSQPFAFKKKECRTNSLGFIGRFTKEKGFTSLLNISVKLKNQYPYLKIFLMGEEPEFISKDLTNANPRIEIITPSFNVEKFYQSIDLLLFLSTAPEGMPLVVLEALSFDVGIVAYPLPGVKEILGNDYPLFINEADDIIKKLSLYYSKSFDLEMLSSINKTISNKHNLHEMIFSIREVYNKISN